jgi:hypothetical protein
MKPVMNSIVGAGSLGSEFIEINNSQTFAKIGDLLKSDRFRVITMENLVLNYSIRNGRVYIQPYQTRIGNKELIMKGDQGIDQTMNYELQMKIPRSELGTTAQEGMAALSSMAAEQGIILEPGETVDVKFMVTGTFSDPVIRPVFGEGVSSITDQVVDQVREQVEEKVDEVREEVRQEVEEARQEVSEEINREAERILSEAQERADQVKQEAKNAGEELVRLAEEEGQKRISDAGSNPLRKVAAEQYARTLKSEAEKNALKLEEEANRRAEEIMKQAREQADRLKQE